MTNRTNVHNTELWKCSSLLNRFPFLWPHLPNLPPQLQQLHSYKWILEISRYALVFVWMHLDKYCTCTLFWGCLFATKCFSYPKWNKQLWMNDNTKLIICYFWQKYFWSHSYKWILEISRSTKWFENLNSEMMITIQGSTTFGLFAHAESFKEENALNWLMTGKRFLQACPVIRQMMGSLHSPSASLHTARSYSDCSRNVSHLSIV